MGIQGVELLWASNMDPEVEAEANHRSLGEADISSSLHLRCLVRGGRLPSACLPLLSLLPMMGPEHQPEGIGTETSVRKIRGQTTASDHDCSRVGNQMGFILDQSNAGATASKGMSHVTGLLYQLFPLALVISQDGTLQEVSCSSRADLSQSQDSFCSRFLLHSCSRLCTVDGPVTEKGFPWSSRFAAHRAAHHGVIQCEMMIRVHYHIYFLTSNMITQARLGPSS